MNEDGLGRRPRRSYARMWISTFLLLIYTAFVLVVTMWPTPGDLQVGGIAERVLSVLHRFGVPAWFGYAELEFTANIGMFVPLGFLLGLALPRGGWWVAALLLPAFSGFIEITQGVALTERVSSVLDVVANTAGGWIGLLFAMVMRALIHGRDRVMIERAIWERDAARVRATRTSRSQAGPEPVTVPLGFPYEPGRGDASGPDAPTLRLPVER